MNNPCKDCKDRFVNENYTCHSFCVKYKQWKEEHEKEKNRLNDQARIDKASYSIDESCSIRKGVRVKRW